MYPHLSLSWLYVLRAQLPSPSASFGAPPLCQRVDGRKQHPPRWTQAKKSPANGDAVGGAETRTGSNNPGYLVFCFTIQLPAELTRDTVVIVSGFMRCVAIFGGCRVKCYSV